MHLGRLEYNASINMVDTAADFWPTRQVSDQNIAERGGFPFFKAFLKLLGLCKTSQSSQRGDGTLSNHLRRHWATKANCVPSPFLSGGRLLVNIPMFYSGKKKGENSQ